MEENVLVKSFERSMRGLEQTDETPNTNRVTFDRGMFQIWKESQKEYFKRCDRRLGSIVKELENLLRYMGRV